jgi:cellulose synthase/poly-beta-1,6-N-acetylglucosamine synthase-like glycosyltransferase
MLLLEVAAFTYLLVMLLISAGWYFTKPFVAKTINSLQKVSVLIAVRNEAENIERLLVSLLKQTYPKDFFEIIIVDDSSEDNTIQAIENFKKEHPDLKIKLSEAKGSGKKDAIRQGIELSQSEIIITTDGDCEVKPEWVLNFVSLFENSNSQMLFGPVLYSHNKSLLQRVFTLEFATLVASGAGSAGFGLPLMGNAANLAFRKEAFEKVRDKMHGSAYASGDDVFLMHAMAKEFGKDAVKFVKNKQSLVETAAPEGFDKFVNQRARWGSKARAYKSVWAIVVSLVVFFFSILLGMTAALSFYRTWFLAVFALFVLLKFMIDFPLSSNFLRFFGRQKLSLLLFPVEFVYPFYIILTAVLSFFKPPEWKGRKLEK